MYVGTFSGDIASWGLCNRCVSTFWERLQLLEAPALVQHSLTQH